MGSSEGRGEVSGGDYGEGRARPSRERMRETRGRRREDERETWGSCGVLWASPGIGRSKRCPARGRRAASTRPASFWREEDGDWQRQQAGPSQVAGPAQVRPRWASFSSFFI